MVKKVSAPAEETARPLFRLTLDIDDVYLGCEQIAPGDIGDQDVVLDHAPDNTPGRYRWARDLKTFIPIEKTGVSR